MECSPWAENDGAGRNLESTATVRGRLPGGGGAAGSMLQGRRRAGGGGAQGRELGRRAGGGFFYMGACGEAPSGARTPRWRRRASPSLWPGMEAGLRWAKRRATAGWWTGLAGLRKLRGSRRPGGRNEGWPPDFVYWAESSHGPKMRK
jgi:hypothetical protein